MQLLARETHRSKVILYASALDEGTLIATYQGVQYGGEAVGKALGYNFTETVNQANRLVISHLQRLLFLAKKHHVGVINVVETPCIL